MPLHGPHFGAVCAIFIMRGFKKRHPFFGSVAGPRSFCKVKSVWQWSNFLHSIVPAGKQILECNLDETSVPLYQEARLGLLAPRAKRKAASTAVGMHRKCSKSCTRAAFTQVTIVCSDPEAQKRIPQILLVRDSMCSKQKVDELRPQLPNHVILWRHKSGWMDVEIFGKVLAELSRSLVEFKETHQLVLSCDAYKAHLNHRCWRAAARHNILMFSIPAKITYALQPLDVYVFALYKRKLRLAAQERAIATGSSAVTLEQTVLALVTAITSVLHGRSWAHAFSRLGLNGQQNDVSETLLKHMAVSATPMVGASFPKLRDLQNCFPARLDVPVGSVFSAVAKIVQGIGPDAAEDPEQVAPSHGDAVSWVGRTRSTSHLALPDQVDQSPVAPATRPRVHPASLVRLHRLPSRPHLPTGTPPTAP